MFHCFISSIFICDSYATMWWPIIGIKFYSILFYSMYISCKFNEVTLLLITNQSRAMGFHCAWMAMKTNACM